MRRRSVARQRGQALLIVMTFVAAFLLVVAAALWLASGALLNLSTVKADTQTTYALDAGVALAMQLVDDKHGNGCNAPGNTSVTLNYPSGPITVNVAITKGNPCRGIGATFNLVVTASGTSRRLNAQVTQGPTAMLLNWEAYQ